MNGKIPTLNDPQLFIDLPEEDTLTIDKLRKYEGLETVTDEEALHIILSIDALCQIATRAVLGINEAA